MRGKKCLPFLVVMFSLVMLGFYTTSKITNAADLVTLYEFDGDFTSVNDPAYDGIASPGVTFVPGQVGQAASFDGGDGVGSNNPDVDHVDSLMTTLASEFNDGFSIMSWVNPDKWRVNWVENTIVSHDQSCCGRSFWGFLLAIDPAGSLVLFMREGNSLGEIFGDTDVNAVEIGKWTHIAVTWNSDPNGGIIFYINGLPVTTNIVQGSRNFIGLNGTGELPIRIGADFADSLNNMHGFFGDIDHISLWKGILTPAEILADYEATIAPTFSSPTNSLEPPMNAGAVTVKKNRVLPLRVALQDGNGLPITDLDITAPPVIQVTYDSGIGGDPIDVTDDALSAGWGTDGNQFEYDISTGLWSFNLKTKNYTAAGTYTISIVSGDEAEYKIDSSITATFVINE